MLVDWQVNNLHVHTLVGTGAYGLVFRASERPFHGDVEAGSGSRDYAVKVIVKTSAICAHSMRSQEEKTQMAITQLHHFMQSFSNRLLIPSVNFESILTLKEDVVADIPHYKEIKLHLKCNDHPNVVTIHQILESSLATFIVMDYVPMDLFTSVVEHSHFSTSVTAVKRVFTQICSALQYCYEQGVYHCDVKPENILIDEWNNNVYICDFGLATTCRALTPNVCVGSSYYMAPERISGACVSPWNNDTLKGVIPTHKADIWSLGVILINLVCIRNPWLKAHRYGDKTFKHYLEDPRVLMEVLPTISFELYDLLVQILQLNPHNRLEISEIIARVVHIQSFTKEGPLSLPDCSSSVLAKINEMVITPKTTPTTTPTTEITNFDYDSDEFASKLCTVNSTGSYFDDIDDVFVDEKYRFGL